MLFLDTANSLSRGGFIIWGLVSPRPKIRAKQAVGEDSRPLRAANSHIPAVYFAMPFVSLRIDS